MERGSAGTMCHDRRLEEPYRPVTLLPNEDSKLAECDTESTKSQRLVVSTDVNAWTRLPACDIRMTLY